MIDHSQQVMTSWLRRLRLGKITRAISTGPVAKRAIAPARSGAEVNCAVMSALSRFVCHCSRFMIYSPAACRHRSCRAGSAFGRHAQNRGPAAQPRSRDQATSGVYASGVTGRRH